MAYLSYETSEEYGRPQNFYKFILGTKVWRYTSADRDKLIDGNVWKAVPISDSGVKLTGDATTDALTITAPFEIGPVQTHVNTPPSQLIQVEIYQKHVDDTDLYAIYVGEVSQVGFASIGQATLTCETLSASMQREGLRLGWQRTCPHALYDERTCKVDKTLYDVDGMITSVQGFKVFMDTASNYAPGYFSGGFIEWTNPMRGGTEQRSIESHTGSELLIFGMTDDLMVGLQIKAYPGCNRSTAACVAFGNLMNYGGVPHMPGKSPFDGDPVF